MIVYNLTDVHPPRQSGRNPRTLQVGKKLIAPGESAELSDDFPLKKISGWVYAGLISIDTIPRWYKEARSRRLQAPVVTPSVPSGPKDKPKSKGSSATIDVGAMEVTVGTGPDGELGTEDDTVEITPKKRRKKTQKE